MGQTKAGRPRITAALAMAALAAALPAMARGAVKPDAGAHPAPAGRVSVELPGGRGGIGLDDLRYSAALGEVLVPAGRTGNLDLIDPISHAVTAIPGFSEEKAGEERHGEGITSVDEGPGFLLVTDRTSRTLDVVDAASRKILSRTALAGGPDYVRYVAPTHEVWVTEPRDEAIEVFALGKGTAPQPVHAGVVKVPGGPESLVVDAARGRAYSNLWKGGTVAIDLKERAVVAKWSNGCGGSRGLALDPSHGWLFVGCTEGKAVVLDVVHGGRVLSEAPTGRGVDIIAYDTALRHLYVPGGTDATLTVLGAGEGARLTVLGTLPTTPRARAVAAGGGTAYVADGVNGRILAVADPYPATH